MQDDISSEDELTLESAWRAAEMVHEAIMRCAAVAERMGHADVAVAIRETVLP